MLPLSQDMQLKKKNRNILTDVADKNIEHFSGIAQFNNTITSL